MVLTVADLNRLMEQVKTDKVRAAATGSSDKLSYIMYNEDGTPNYRNTLIAALATTAGISELNKLRILALYDNSGSGGIDNLIQQIADINNTISDINNKITLLETQIDGVGDITDEINSLKTQLSGLQSLYNTLNNTVTELNSSVSELKITVDSIDITTISEKVDNVENSIEEINNKISDIDNRVSELEDGSGTPSTGGLEQRVQTLEESIQTINDKLTQYDETLQQINYNVTQAVQTASNAQSAVNNLSNIVSNHTDAISTLQSNIRTINTDITNIKQQLSSITPGGDVDLSDYVTRTELLNQLTSMIVSLRGATIYNVHVLGWHNDATMNFSPETYPDADDNNAYFEQYGMIAAKEITSKTQLLGLTADASTVATWITDIMYVETLEDVWKMMEAHSTLCALGYAKPKSLYYGFDGTTITMDSYWGFGKGCIIRCKISESGVSFEELVDFETVLNDIVSNTNRISSLESRVSALE